MAEKAEDKYKVPAVDKAMKIIEYLSESGGRKLNDICSDLNISKTTVYSILQCLINLEYAYSENGVYRLTLKLFSLGMKIKRDNPFEEPILEELEKIREITRQTVHFITILGNHSVLSYKLDGPGIVRFTSYVGETKPLHLSGAGKAALAFLGQDRINSYLKAPLENRTEKTKSDPGDLSEELAEIRKKGYSVDDEEGEKGVFCIGVPVFMSGGEIYGAVSISVLKGSINQTIEDQYIEEMIHAGKNISCILGYDVSLK